MESIKNFINEYMIWLSIPDIGFADVFEIGFLAFIIYQIIKWIKNTRAWSLVKGLVVILSFWIITLFFNLNVLQWIISNTISVGIIALIVVFQPEFRKALEQLGQRNIIRSVFSFDDSRDGNEMFSDYTLDEIVRTSFELARKKTGALMVIEGDILLNEFINTGIYVDSAISSELLINIFEPNTPLHDGAVIIRKNRIVAATCYLPLSDNMRLSKELGTRHRAGIGISEMSDSLTIIVSEETGKVSIAKDGKLIRNIDGDYLRAKLVELQRKDANNNKKIKLWKGRSKT